MSIEFQENEKIFTVSTASSTYQMKVDDLGFLLHLYYGPKSAGSMEYLLTYYDRGFSGNPYEVQENRGYSLDVLPQEMPFWGQGDYRSTALLVRDGNGVCGCDLRYAGYEIREGKYSLPGLPAVYASREEAGTLMIFLKDELLHLKVTLFYAVLPDIDVITRAAVIENAGRERVSVERAFSATLDFVTGDYDLIMFQGRHAMERAVQRTKVEHGATVIGSRRGMSSHQYNPMVILCDRDTGEEHGRCWSMQFVYSGGFKALAEKDQFSQTRLQMGLMDENFSYPLSPGERLICPEAIMSYSGEGLAKLSHNLHACIRSHVCRGKYRDVPRPVLFNSWEAAYFDFTGETIVTMAKNAAALGAEMLVMDDGWFGARNDDFRGLGDWIVNEEKLGCMIGGLADAVRREGLKFGLWIEPEMVNEDSDLYRAHPDWALAVPGRKPVMARNQMVLDFSRREVVDHVFDQICAVLDECRADYVKWDYNRCIYEVYSHGAEDQGKVLYDYMLGVYDFLDRLTKRYPNLLLEGCSGGGGRFDAGMLYYAPQIWCSDNSDAVDRLTIQHGTSFGYPPFTMGAHVSVCPNEQNGRVTPFETRAAVAMAGTFGYELDPAKLSDEEKEMVRQQIRDYHTYAQLMHDGDYYRLGDPARDPVCAWESAAPDGSEVLVTGVVLDICANRPVSYVRPKGLTKGAFYRDDASGKVYPADALMDTGIPLPFPHREYESFVIHFIRE